MIEIKTFVCNMLQENCYVVSDPTGEAVIIDCGVLYEEERLAIVNYMKAEELKPVRLLCTHGHFDHNLGNAGMWREYGLKPEVAEEDLPLTDLRKQMEEMLGTSYPCNSITPGRILADGEKIRFGSHELEVLHTPGHTRGSVTFYCAEEHVAFTGDTLFRMSIGRTDFAGGSWSDMQKSLKLLAELPGETIVYPGHGGATTIGYEKRYNPYMR